MTSIVSGLSPSQITALPLSTVSQFTTADITAMTTAQVGALTAPQINALSPGDVRSFSTAQIGAISYSTFAAIAAIQTGKSLDHADRRAVAAADPGDAERTNRRPRHRRSRRAERRRPDDATGQRVEHNDGRQPERRTGRDAGLVARRRPLGHAGSGTDAGPAQQPRRGGHSIPERDHAHGDATGRAVDHHPQQLFGDAGHSALRQPAPGAEARQLNRLNAASLDTIDLSRLTSGGQLGGFHDGRRQSQHQPGPVADGEQSARALGAGIERLSTTQLRKKR